jgi:hypothetical protein
MKFLKSFLVVLLVMIPVTAFAEKAKTIEELAAMYDSSSCKECHAEIYAQWEKSHHARSLMGVLGGLFMTPLAMKDKTPFSPDDPSQVTLDTFPCFKCHLPQAVTSGSDDFAKDYAKALVAQDKKRIGQLNISCLVCHNTKAIIHKRDEGHPEKGVLYSTKEVKSHDHPDFKTVKKSSIMDHSIMCGQCHGQGPNLEFENPVQCATLYGSYQHNYLSKGGQKSCQECHMGDNADHLFAPNWNDLEGTKKLLQEAISLDIDTVGYDWLLKSKDYKPMVVVNTRINTTAGHRIPDG